MICDFWLMHMLSRRHLRKRSAQNDTSANDALQEST